MDLFTLEVCTFLNKLDDYIPQLMRDASLSIIQQKVLADVNSMIVYGNEYAVLNRISQYIIKCLFDVQNLYIRTVALGDDGEYMLSDYHMEFELTDKSLQYIKSIISNKTISNRSFVFVIKYADSSLNRNLFLELRRLMDLNVTSKFIITATSTSFIEKSLISRCVVLNCIFPLDKIIASDLIPDNLTGEKTHIEQAFIESKANVITFLQHISLMKAQGNNNKIDTKLLWHKHIDKLLMSLKDEVNQLSAICIIREVVYKVYHVNIPLRDICHYVLRSLRDMYPITVQETPTVETIQNTKVRGKGKTSKNNAPPKDNNNDNLMIEFVAICASCEGNGLGNKNILSYERLFCQIYRVMLLQR
jgi:hypothetical protein